MEVGREGVEPSRPCGQGILSPSVELIKARSGLMNLWRLLGQGILKTEKYLLISMFYGDNLWITCQLSQ
jgi:hypothetical protein